MDFSRQQYVYALLWSVKYSTIRLNRFRVILISAFCWRSSTGNSYLIYTIWINCGLLSVTTWVRAFIKFLCSTQPTFAARSSSKIPTEFPAGYRTPPFEYKTFIAFKHQCSSNVVLRVRYNNSTISLCKTPRIFAPNCWEQTKIYRLWFLIISLILVNRVLFLIINTFKSRRAFTQKN